MKMKNKIAVGNVLKIAKRNSTKPGYDGKKVKIIHIAGVIYADLLEEIRVNGVLIAPLGTTLQFLNSEDLIPVFD